MSYGLLIQTPIASWFNLQAMLADDVSTSEPVQGTPASESTAKPVYVTPVSEDTSKPANFKPVKVTPCNESTAKPVRSEHAYMTHASESTTKPVNFDLEMDRSPALDVPDMTDAYQEIIGTKCRAPFVQDWGEKIFSNAMIAAVETESEVEMPKVYICDVGENVPYWGTSIVGPDPTLPIMPTI